jgi:hypothetical protein
MVEEYLQTIASGAKHVLITYVSAYGYTAKWPVILPGELWIHHPILVLR